MRKVMYLLALRGSVWISNARSHRLLSDGQYGSEAPSHIHLKKNPGLQRRCPIFFLKNWFPKALNSALEIFQKISVRNLWVLVYCNKPFGVPLLWRTFQRAQLSPQLGHWVAEGRSSYIHRKGYACPPYPGVSFNSMMGQRLPWESQNFLVYREKSKDLTW